MVQLPKLIVRGRYFKLFQQLPKCERDKIAEELEIIRQDDRIKKHENDIAKVLYDTIKGEYTNIQYGRHEVNIPIWKALIVIKVNDIQFETYDDKIRYICGYINNYIQQTIRENKRKTYIKYYKYHGTIQDVVEQAIHDILNININNYQIDDTNAIKEFVDKNFSKYGVSFIKGKLTFKVNSTIKIVLMKKEFAMELNNTEMYGKDLYSSVMDSMSSIEDDDYISTLKYHADKHTRIIIDAIMDGSITRGKSKISPKIIAKFLQRNGYECKMKHAINIYNNIGHLMLLAGSSDPRLIQMMAESKY